MKKLFTLLSIILLIAGAITLIKKKKEELQNLPTPIVPNLVVNRADAILKEVNQTKKLLGKYYTLKEAKLATKLPGFIKEIYVKEGQKVKKDTILIEIDSKDIVAQITTQKTLINNIKSQVLAQEALFKAAKIDEINTLKSLQRDKKLYKAGALAKERLELKESQYEAKKAKTISAKISLESKKRELKAAIKTLKAKENLLNYTKIKAPYDGIVANIFFKKGSFAPLAKPLISILGESFVVDAPFSGEIKEGMRAYILNRSFKISKILPQSLNSLKIARINTTNLNIPNNTQVNVKVIQKSKKGYALPLKALYEEGKDYYVFVYKNNMFSPIKIEIEVLGDRYFIPKPQIKESVAVGSNEKLAKLFLQGQKSE